MFFKIIFSSVFLVFNLYSIASKDVGLKNMPEACLNLKPIESDYTPKGKIIKVGDMEVYETGKWDSGNLLINIYDIFGFHPNTQQVADKISDGGFLVAMPDFWRGKPWDKKKWPVSSNPQWKAEFDGFLKNNGSWDKVIRNDVMQMISYYKQRGISHIGIYGFCWGGKMTLLAASDKNIESIQAASLVHPAFVSTEEANNVVAPILLCPSKDESDMIPFYEILKGKFTERCVGHHRFNDMHHGFAAARGDFSNELNRKRVNELIYLLVEFFDKHFT